MARLHVEITGRVQGVGFRWFVREQARGAGLSGWVMNRPDGSVELLAEGRGEALQSLRAAVQQGPPGAAVEAVRELPDTGEPLSTPFSLKRESA